jgi:phage-related protein
VQTNRKSLSTIQDNLETLQSVIGQSFISYLQQFKEAINQDGWDKEFKKIESFLNTLLLRRHRSYEARQTFIINGKKSSK